MFDTNELNDKLVSELRDIARNLGITEADTLRKAELIERIVEQEMLIEAARAQQSTVNTIYTPKGAEPVENTEKSRKRTRTVKSSTQPRVEVPLDDTNLFDAPDDEANADDQENETGGNMNAEVPFSGYKGRGHRFRRAFCKI